MLRASIDIGSNSILLLVLDVNEDGTFTELVDESKVTALGKDLDKTGVFATESMEASRSALGEYAEIIKKHKIDPREVIVTATEAARVAGNANDFFSEIKNTTGLAVKIISGEGEAYYTTMGVVRGLSEKESTITVMDIGGASTELIKISIEGDKFNILDTVSLPIGSVRANDWMSDSQTAFENNITKLVRDDSSLDTYKTNKLICVAGTMTSVGAMIKNLDEFKAKVVHNLLFDKNKLKELSKSLSNLSLEQILEQYPFLGKRAKTIFAGTVVANEIADKLIVDEFEVSTYGLRYGTALSGKIDERFSK